MKKLTLLIMVILAAAAVALGQYRQPPKEIMDVLNAAPIPGVSISPSHDKMLLSEPLRYPPISELAEPMLRIAGMRINPNNNGRHRQPYSVRMWLKNVADGKETPIAFPAGAKLFSAEFSPDGKHIAVGNVTPRELQLWLVDTATAKAWQVKGVALNTTMGGVGWEDNDMISTMLVSSKRGAPPVYRDVVPTEPAIQETTGKKAALVTYEDLMKNPTDEKLFDYYCTSQLALIDVNSGKVREIGTPAIYDSADYSPDGKYVIVERIERPYSYLVPSRAFPHKVEVWDVASGKLAYKVVDVPLLDNLPNGFIQTGPRSVRWIPAENATLMWTEALDGGNPRAKVTPRDKVVTFAAPFAGQPKELIKTENRFAGGTFGERDGMMLFSDTNRDTNRRRLFITDYRNPGATPKMISDLSTSDRYNDPGQPVLKRMPNGVSVIRMNGDYIYLTGQGATPDGDRPFLRRLNLKTLEKDEMFRSGKEEYESFAGFADETNTKFFTRKETVTEPPNVYLRDGATAKALTNFKDPSPQLRGITKQLVKYKRPDGVDLSFTLYLPPGYKPGTRLPTVVWAYPLEFTDGSLAGQVSGSTNRFTQITGYSHLFFAMLGYAVLDNATMPIVGDPMTVNDTYVDQVVSSAKAAIDKATEMGVTDPDRVGVGGHSYGAFMTANLLAHSNLFRAGIARSGAYNRTLTPFGFQSERRTFWEAPAMYEKVSPFFYADKINEPLLMIHGEADDNTGTFPIQSERLYAALSGLGGTARLVMLPLEAHGYTAKESTEHVLFEMVNWFEKYVKNAKPREKNVAGAVGESRPQ